MIVDYKCDTCAISSICSGKTKLKPFTEDAKVDLGIMLRMVECVNYREDIGVEPQEGILLDEEDTD